MEDHGPADGSSSSSAGSDRTFLGEGPVVLGRLQGVPVLQMGMPENIMTWHLTPELPCLKASATAYMFAVAYSQTFYILEFMPGDTLLFKFDRCVGSANKGSLGRASNC